MNRKRVDRRDRGREQPSEVAVCWPSLIQIAMCDISKSVDAETGKEIEVPLYDYTAEFNTQPNWFLFELKARSGEKGKLMEQTLERNRRDDPLLGR